MKRELQDEEKKEQDPEAEEETEKNMKFLHTESVMYMLLLV